MIFGFGLIAVINGVFIKETFKVAESDDRFMLMQQEHQQRMHVKKMKDLFSAADTDGSGGLSFDEFKEIMEINHVKSWLAAMQLETESVEALFSLIDSNGDGELTVEELVTGAGRLKGTAKNFDVVTLTVLVREMNQNLDAMHKQINALAHQAQHVVTKQVRNEMAELCRRVLDSCLSHVQPCQTHERSCE